MEYSQLKLFRSLFFVFVTTLLLTFSFSRVANCDPVRAYFADEHNDSSTSPTGNRIIEVDLDTMSLVNTLDVPGFAGHHADNTFNSKIYAVPKGSNFVNVVELRKNEKGYTLMRYTKQINLIHTPRSGDAYNQKYHIILMAAANRPMASFIDVETDEVVGTIGENIDCTLTDGSRLLSHSDANTHQGALKYHCATTDHGGNQISGHPYWLTPDYAAVIDRSNRLIAVYYVWKDGNKIKSRILNYLHTRSAVHQIIPRDRSSLPLSQQADFYAVEEGKHADTANYSGGIAHALIKMKLTSSGLKLVKRMDLQRTQVLPKVKADRILNACVSIYRNTNNYRNGRTRQQAYDDLFATEGIVRSKDQDINNDFPIDCFYPGIPGGHNADFAPNNKHLYVPMAGGAMSIIDVDRWKITNNLDIGRGSGVGHVCFSKKHDLAITTNHANGAIRIIRRINSARPVISQYLLLGFPRENISSSLQSHSCHIDRNEDYYYNFWSDGGEFFKIDLDAVESNTVNASPAPIVDSIYTGGVPIQGSYISVDNIITLGSQMPFTVSNDTATTNGSAILIDVLQNDTGTNLKLELVDAASNGTVSIQNGMLRYVPNTGFKGTDAFWYGVSSSDNNNDWKWGLVTINVNSASPSGPLKAYKDVVSTTKGRAIAINILSNDIGKNIHIGWFDDPDNGSASIKNNHLVYTPDAGFSGVDDFWYEIVDSSGQTTWGNIVVTVGDALVAYNDKATVARGESVFIDVLANDTGSNRTIATVDSVWTGSISIRQGKVFYRASGSYTGDLNVWYAVTDSQGNYKWAMITITIKGSSIN